MHHISKANSETERVLNTIKLIFVHLVSSSWSIIHFQLEFFLNLNKTEEKKIYFFCSVLRPFSRLKQFFSSYFSSHHNYNSVLSTLVLSLKSKRTNYITYIKLFLLYPLLYYNSNFKEPITTHTSSYSF